MRNSHNNQSQIQYPHTCWHTSRARVFLRVRLRPSIVVSLSTAHLLGKAVTCKFMDRSQ